MDGDGLWVGRGKHRPPTLLQSHTRGLPHSGPPTLGAAEPELARGLCPGRARVRCCSWTECLYRGIGAARSAGGLRRANWAACRSQGRAWLGELRAACQALRSLRPRHQHVGWGSGAHGATLGPVS